VILLIIHDMVHFDEESYEEFNDGSHRLMAEMDDIEHFKWYGEWVVDREPDMHFM